MNTVSYGIVDSETKRKVEIRFSKIDSIGKVLKAACKTLQLSPENYELRYAKRKLDLNMNLMFFDLPEGVFLELYPKTKADEKFEFVTVNLIIGEETVNSGTFRKNATLWDVSQNLIPKDKFVEEDRISMSFLNKRFNGPAMLKKIPLSSLKSDEGPLNFSLNRMYSSENLTSENDKGSVRRNSKTFSFSQYSNSSSRSHNKAGTSKGSVNRYDSTTKLEDCIIKDTVRVRKNKSDNPSMRNLTRNSSKKFELSKSRLLGNNARLGDTRNFNTMVGRNVTTKLTAKASIDKNFYLTSEKKLKDLKYLNSRQGIAYVNKLPVMGEIPRDSSAVDLLDLGRDSSRSSNGNVELKLFLPDETAVQAIFRCDETVEDVFQFLNPLLRCQPSDYFLYSTSPTESVDKNTCLYELEDSSGVNLYFSLNRHVKKLWPKCKPFLKEEHLPKKD